MTGRRMPAEWAPHARTWMAWPCARHTFGPELEKARLEFLEIAHTIALFEPVSVLYDPQNSGGIESLSGVENFEITACPLDDFWLRDSGPTFVVEEDGSLAGVDWKFDGWGSEWPHEKDQKTAGRILELAGASRRTSDMVFEGGALTIDDRGTIVTTRQCYEHRTRNGGPSRASIFCAGRGAIILSNSKALDTNQRLNQYRIKRRSSFQLFLVKMSRPCLPGFVTQA